MGQHIRSSLQVLIDAVEESTGVTVPPVRFMAALLRSIEKSSASERRLAIAIGHRRLKCSYSAALNAHLARTVARWGLRALGHEARLRESYPLYQALARAHGVTPWSFTWYQTHAFSSAVPQSERPQ